MHDGCAAPFVAVGATRARLRVPRRLQQAVAVVFRDVQLHALRQKSGEERNTIKSQRKGLMQNELPTTPITVLYHELHLPEASHSAECRSSPTSRRLSLG